tara:strand:+ start:1628 stop:2620 length:993 start_codon:yes stop_codon:yes gene_type:complete
MAKKVQIPYNYIQEEINFSQLFDDLWRGKLKIILITVILFLGGIIYNSSTKSNYQISVEIYPNSNTKFTKYFSLNNLFSEVSSGSARQNTLNSFLHSDFRKFSGNDDIYQISPLTILNEFEIEFKKKNTTIETLLEYKKSDKSGENNYSREELYSIAKDFEFVQIKNSETDRMMRVQWQDPAEAKILIYSIINKTLKKVHANFLDDINFIQANIDNASLIHFRKINSKIDEIISNLSPTTPDEQFLYIEYITLKKELDEFQNDLASIELQKIIENFAQDDPSSWLVYDVNFADIKNNNKPELILFISLIFGLIFGSIYVSAFNKINEKKY